MRWTKPDFQEITLNMEVTGYVNTDDDVDTVERVANLPAASEQAGRQPGPPENQA
jgi:coenzyme PQQ precursor peptide PqqA